MDFFIWEANGRAPPAEAPREIIACAYGDYGENEAIGVNACFSDELNDPDDRPIPTADYDL